LKGYAAAARGEAVSLDAQMPVELEPLVEPPFHALEVQPAITFTYGGLAPAFITGRRAAASALAETRQDPACPL
jgi:hypothetical protein